MKRFLTFLMLISVSQFGTLRASDKPDPEKLIPKGAKVFVANMNGFETYITGALTKKEVPILLVNDREKADFEITGNSESEKAGWTKMVTGRYGSNESASVTVTNLKSGVVAWGYNVNKGNSVRGKQSAAEACAVHLRDKIDTEAKGIAYKP